MARAVLFVSSVQKELAQERRAIREFVQADALLRRFFTVFLFEDLPAADRRANEVYLEQVDLCEVFVSLLGDEYGREDEDGLSPTEHEFERATLAGKPRLVFVRGPDNPARHPKMAALVRKAGDQLIRRRFNSIPELTEALYSSLVEHMESRGLVQSRPFEDRIEPDRAPPEMDAETLAGFVRRARHERQFPLAEGSAADDVLAHLHLAREGRPTYAAVLLFGRDPQRDVPAADVRCMHFHGTEVQRPVPLYRVFKGNLFEQVDRSADFVLSVLHRAVGTRAESARAPVTYEIPPEVVREAIVNAVAHRDYTSPAAVQVSVFADRVEVWNPGVLTPPLTPDRLRVPHGSLTRNPRMCDALFLARYIEKYGTGTLMMIAQSRGHGLPEPEFEQRDGQFVVTLWRDWLTAEFLARTGLNDRQVGAMLVARQERRLTNARYQEVSAATRGTAKRDLEDLVRRGMLQARGAGRGAHYEVPARRPTHAHDSDPPAPENGA